MKNETGIWRLVACALMIGSLSGCVTGGAFKLYSGSAKGEKEVTRLVVPAELEVSFCDGFKVSDSDLKSAGTERELHFLPGLHFIDVRYDVVFMDDQNRAVKVKSASKLVEFHGKPGFCYKIYIPKIRTIADAKKFADDPILDVQADMYSGRSFSSPRPPVAVPQNAALSNVPVAQPAVAAKPVPVIQPVKQPVPAPAKVAPVVTKAVTPARSATAAKPAQSKANPVKETDTLQNLKEWYNKASPEEKVEFDKWRKGVGK